MTLTDVVSTILLAVVGTTIAKKLLDYLNFHKQRMSIEISLGLRKIVFKDTTHLASLETRDRARRRVLITASELYSPDSVRKTYENLLEKDLSKDSSRVLELQLIDEITKNLELQISRLQRSELENFEMAIDCEKRTPAWKLINSGLIQAAIASRLSDVGAHDIGESSILGLMLGRRMEAYARSYAYSFAALAVGFVLHFTLAEPDAAYISIVIPLILLTGLTINQKVLEFRVSRGYFGNNASEATEFIKFIQSHRDKSDFNDGDRIRKLHPESERDQPEKVMVFGPGATT